MNAAQVAAILEGADLSGGPAPGQLCTSCKVPMKRLEGKLAYLLCPCCGCSPERGWFAGMVCEHPAHPEGTICA